MNDIANLLSFVTEAQSKNVLSLEDVRRWLTDYLEMHAEEVSRFPAESGRVHWDLLGADYDQSKDATFLAALFHGDSVTFLAGRGSICAVHDFAARSFPKDPNLVLDELASRFVTSVRTSVLLGDLDRWLKS